MMPPVREWFEGWLDQHRSWNPGPGWNSFAAGENPFVPWLVAFVRNGVTEAEAEAASCELAAGEPSYPEHHLHRLLGIIRQARSASVGPVPPPAPWQAAADAETARRDEVSALVDAEWARLDQPAREHWRRKVREVAPGAQRIAAYLEAMAKQAHAETVRPELRLLDPDGFPEFILDALRRDATRPDPGERRVAPPPIPPKLTPEQERAARERADVKRRDVLAQLEAMQRRRSGPTDPPTAAPDPRRSHAHAV